MPGGWPWDLTSPSTVGYHEKILLLQIQARKSSVKTSRTHFLLKKNISMFWIKILSCFTGVCLKNQKNPWTKAPQTHKNAQFYPNWPHSFILRMQRKITHHLRNALRKAKKNKRPSWLLDYLGTSMEPSFINRFQTDPTWRWLMAQTSPRPTTLGWCNLPPVNHGEKLPSTTLRLIVEIPLFTRFVLAPSSQCLALGI